MSQSTEAPAVAPLYVEVLGTRYAIHAPDERQREVLAREWSRCAAPGGGEGTEPLTVSPGYSDEVAGYALASELTMKGIHALRGRYLMLHAAGLSDARGRVIALVAPSGAGKTMAALRLARAGLGYVTDETVAIDAVGEVLPYPKPLSVVDADEAGGAKLQHGPDDLHLGLPPKHLRASRVVLIRRGPGHEGSPTLEPLPLIDGLLELIPQTSSLSLLDRPLQRACRLIDEAGGVHRLTYTEVADTADLLTEFLAGASPRAAGEPTWEPFTEDVPTGDELSWAMLDNRVRLRPHTDAILVGEEALIMVADVPVRLGGIGLTVWQACRDAPTIDEIAQIVAAAHGPHPDARRIIDETLFELKQSGVVAWGRPVPVAEVLPPQDR